MLTKQHFGAAVDNDLVAWMDTHAGAYHWTRSHTVHFFLASLFGLPVGERERKRPRVVKPINPRKPRQQLTFSVGADVLTQLDAYADQRGQSRSEVIDYFLRVAMERYPTPQFAQAAVAAD